MRRIKAEPEVKDVAKGSINARDYIGAALNKLASQCKALLLRVKRGNAPAASTECPHGKIELFCPDCTRDNEAESNGSNPTQNSSQRPEEQAGSVPKSSAGQSNDDASYETKTLAGKGRESASTLLNGSTSTIHKLEEGASLLDAHTS